MPGCMASLAGAIAAAAMIATGASARDHVPAGARYVAMGSSFASGPGITTPAPGAPPRCGRSRDNYPHQLARARSLDLVDATCAGATTANLLGAWNELPPQVDALTADTRLVTVTIGGNDVGYVGGLFAAACLATAGATPAAARRCPPEGPAGEAEWTALEAGMTAIAREVRRRSPEAMLVFVDYPAIVPEHGGCAALPIADAAVAQARRVAARLAAVTARVAKEAKARILPADISRGHDACAAIPWTRGGAAAADARGRAAAYHPDLAGMTAIAAALDRMLR